MALQILTTDSNGYIANKNTAIYPAYVDRMPYESYLNDTDPYNISRRPYFDLQASGGSNYLWNIEGGSLPPGLTFDGALGRISGTPIKEGDYTFNVRVASGAETITKNITLQSKPYRGKFISELAFGVVIHWGRFSEIQLTDPITSTAVFEARITNFNANVWADKFVELGIKIVHFSAIWQDSYRNWPSTTDTRLELKTTRNISLELLNACNARGIKMLVYWPVEYLANPLNITDGSQATNAWGSMNLGLLKEVVQTGYHGAWVDVGGNPEMYNVNANNSYWEYMITIARENNPDFVLGVNPGIRLSGMLAQFPYTDFVITEGVPTSSQGEGNLEVAIPAWYKKKLGNNVSNMLIANWAFPSDGATKPIKFTAGLKNNIIKNLAKGVGIHIALPVRADGLLLDPHYEPVMTELGSLITSLGTVKASTKTDPIVENNIMTIDNPERTRIFYTDNNSIPTVEDKVYIKPIKFEGKKIIQHRSFEVGKILGISEITLVDTPINTINYPIRKNIITPPSDDSISTHANSFHRGMMFRTRKTPLIITRIGRRGTATTEHSVVIKRFSDNYPILLTTLKPSDPVENGYQYVSIPPTRLEIGTQYYAAFQENTIDTYYSNNFSSLTGNQDIRMVSQVILSATGDKYSNIAQNGLGQYINLEYYTLDNETTNDLLAGAPTVFRSNSGGSLSPSAGIYHAINAVDSNPESMAVAGGDYAYTLQSYFEKTTLFNFVRVDFGIFGDGYPTRIQLYSSYDSNSLTLLTDISNIRSDKLRINLPRISGRYLHLRALTPNAQGQLGGQMAVSRFSAYNIE